MNDNEIKIYYLYFHIRNDNNEIFYVGIGTKQNKVRYYDIYSRAYNKSKRTIFWKTS